MNSTNTFKNCHNAITLICRGARKVQQLLLIRKKVQKKKFGIKKVEQRINHPHTYTSLRFNRTTGATTGEK